MPKLVLSTFVSETVMGAQVYERAIDQRAEAALAASSQGWKVQRVKVRSLRSPLPGNRRVPLGWMLNASARTRRGIARLLYPEADLVHRMKVGLPPAPGKDVITLHDVGPWKFSDEAKPLRAAREELRRARAIVTVSEFSAGEIVDLFGTDDPVVIHNGFDRERFDAATPIGAQELALLGVSGDYVLSAGGASERKNLDGLAAAWPFVRTAFPRLTLVLAGPEHPRRTRLFKDLSGVVMVGRVDDDLLPSLMAGARAVVVPSVYEGFGLPALEAMAVGVPLVATRAGSLPEVVGDGGILVGRSPAELAEGIVWAVSADSDVERMVAMGRKRSEKFTWESAMAEHVRLWKRLV